MKDFCRAVLVGLLCLMLLPVSALGEDGSLAMGGTKVEEPEVRWTYGVSLTALQSPYLRTRWTRPTSPRPLSR